MGPDGHTIYFSLALSIGIERKSAGYNVVPWHAATAWYSNAQKTCL